ncbi:hypothetical protein BEL07_19025 [Mycolicibacterium grossiae]|uniref:Uncharacterized protein n=1 Tax=Mycolicibacterium grossiae TaxID=1552759 RepID=A0A1E8Q0Z3_9MYCO|nr:hypothetical protein [Mycolicibacterium grossiae]OFJ52173.1 hypothetical protein BEL07_19025 [Mycolicibacterium grossiae]
MGVASSDTQRAHGAALWNGFTLGPLATLSALLLLMLVEVPRTGAPVTAAAVGPTTIFLFLALVSLARGQGRTAWWVLSAVGAIIGTALTAAAIIGAISGIAYMLSDPG